MPSPRQQDTLAALSQCDPGKIEIATVPRDGSGYAGRQFLERGLAPYWHWIGLEHFVASPHADDVRALRTTSSIEPWSGQAESVALIGDLDSLEAVQLRRLVGDPERGLANWAALERLESLSLLRSPKGISFSFLAALPSLRALSLSQCDTALEPLESIAHLTDLRLRGSKLTDDRVAVLSRLERLTTLNLNGTHLSDEAFATLGALGCLQRLSLRGTSLTNEGLRSLGRHLELRELSLGGLKISNAGLQHLRPLRQLTRLILPAKKITEAGIEALHDLKQLQRLSFTEVCDIDDGAFAQLREAIGRPELKISRRTTADYHDMLDRRF